MKRRTRLAAGAGIAIAAVGAGGAVAASQLSPAEESKAVVADAAKQLGVDPAKLNSALKQALANRVDAAVKEGRLTEEQGKELKARIQAGAFPIFGMRGGRDGAGHHGRAFGHHLDAAASYLGVTEAALRTSLESGKTLADVAKAQGKSVDGLIAALVADETKELDAAVAAGRLTTAQRDEIVAGLTARTTAIVNGQRPAKGPEGHGRGFGGPGFGPPPGDARFDDLDEPPAAA